MDPYQNLANAIVLQAARDYRSALCRQLGTIGVPCRGLRKIHGTKRLRKRRRNC